MYAQTNPRHLNNRKLSDEAWLAYLVLEMHALGDRFVIRPYQRLHEYLGVGSRQANWLLLGLGLNCRPWIRGPITGTRIDLHPVLSDKDRANDISWVKVHNWLVLAKGFQSWEKRVVARLLTPTRKHSWSSSRRTLSFKKLTNCRIPARTRSQRRDLVYSIGRNRPPAYL